MQCIMFTVSNALSYVYLIVRLYMTAGATTQSAGTYVVTIENEHGSEKCSATLIVTQDAKEMEDWMSQLKKA